MTETTADFREYLRERVLALGGEIRRLQWVVDDGGPDAMVLLPGRAFMAIIQEPTHSLPALAYRRAAAEPFLDAGVHVEVIDSRAAVDAALRVNHDRHNKHAH